MSIEAWTAIAKGLVEGIPRIVEAVRQGRRPEHIRLGDFMSTDALKQIRAANTRARDFIATGQG